ncbi:MAG TPA: ATP-binding protein [Phycisphaerae bacterium]|nr:ATP-binding protein [Phycisphaerae bacterium]
MTIPSDFRAAAEAEEAVLQEVARHGYSEASLFALKLALEEGLNNAIRHGNRFDRNKAVELSFEVDDRRVVIEISDQGNGFDPAGVPDPTTDENIEKPCGRGIMLMRAYMDEVRFSRHGCRVRMTKKNIH